MIKKRRCREKIFMPVYTFWSRPPVARDHAPLADAADAGLFVDAADTKKNCVT